MDVDDFFAFQDGYRNKALAVMEKIWHRGCILIAKKFKSFGTKSFEAWTFSGSQKLSLRYSKISRDLKLQSMQRLEKGAFGK
jgi:hypothetical protein